MQRPEICFSPTLSRQWQKRLCYYPNLIMPAAPSKRALFAVSLESMPAESGRTSYTYARRLFNNEKISLRFIQKETL